MTKIDTSAEAVERMASRYSSQAATLQECEAAGYAPQQQMIREAEETAATLRVLAAERDELAREKATYESPAWEANERLIARVDELLVERDAERAKMARLREALIALKGYHLTGDAFQRIGLDPRGPQEAFELACSVLSDTAP